MKIRSTVGIAIIALLAASFAFPLTSTFAAEPSFGHIFYNDTIVRTVIPPSATDVALDNFYMVTNGASGQLGIASVAPGNINYHGGHWKVFLVTFSSGVTPFLLTSEAAVFTAQVAGQVTVTRASAMDFLCPIQP